MKRITEEEACLYLTRVRDAKRDIALLVADYRWACDGIERLKQIQIHGNLAASIANTKRYAKRVTVKRDALLRFREEAAARIERLPDVRFREIFRCRYLEGDTWEWIAGGLCYDVRHVQRLHKRALAAVAQERPRKNLIKPQIGSDFSATKLSKT